MKRSALSLLAVLVGAGLVAAPAPARAATEPMAVVALVDSGINPYSAAFRDRSPIAQRHPSTYLPGYPKDAEALRLTLDRPYKEARERDDAVWKAVEPGVLYWIPGTRIVGAVSLSAGGRLCPTVPLPPANGPTSTSCTETPILDDHGHGSMTASRAAGAPSSLAPNARIVEIEGLGAGSVDFAVELGFVDVISNSWGSLAPLPGVLSSNSTGTWRRIAAAAKEVLVVFASGNGLGLILGVAPHPTYFSETLPAGVVIVGGHDNGRITFWASAPPHVVADAYGGKSAIRDSSGPTQPDPIACCTSAAAPYASGGATALVLEARRILGHAGTGVKKGVFAKGRSGTVRAGPLADGDFTLEELRTVLMRTAEVRPAEGRDDGLLHWAGKPGAPEHTTYGPGANPFCIMCTTTPVSWTLVPTAYDAYQHIGYGAINERSIALGVKVLRGEVPMPIRPTEDANFARDQQIRSTLGS